jgi:hydroxymethylglutaryl-CoA lyase
MSRPQKVHLYEVGPRDGLQAEATIIPTEIKIKLIESLAETGLKTIESASFVSPKWVPQMADAHEVMSGLKKHEGVSYPVLTPNLKGYEAARDDSVSEIALFGAASESFSLKNINATRKESLIRFSHLTERAHNDGVKIRGYVSCVIACPYDGPTNPHHVLDMTKAFLDQGCYQISLGDTTGVGTPTDWERLFDVLLKNLKPADLAIHAHDTYGQALANILVALDRGLETIDASIGGLGGCPYAPGAAGNVATEDVLYMLNGMDIETGVDIAKLVDCAYYISDALQRPPISKVAKALGRSSTHS